MEPTIENLMVKVKAIAQGPNADLLLKLVNVLYEREGSYFINIDVLRHITSMLESIKLISDKIDSDRHKLEDGEIFDLVSRISVAARMALDYLKDPTLHEID